MKNLHKFELLLTAFMPAISADIISCQPGFVPSKQEISYPFTPCEPCKESGQSYPGYNINLTPNYGVATWQLCREQCREEARCNYFTYDTSNLWCYLKTTKSSVRHSHPRYISGSNSILCEDDNDNEIEVDAKLEEETQDEERQKKPSKTSSSPTTKELATPILSVYHASGYRTVLSAIPSTFGLKIHNDTEITGHLFQLEEFLCSSSFKNAVQKNDKGNQFAVVRRGVCKFVTKVENAVKAGFDGVVILDSQNDTDVKRISGEKTSLTENVPVIFLLHKEANILKRLLAESQNLSAVIQDSTNFSWFKRKPTAVTSPLIESTTRQISGEKKFLLGMRVPPLWSYSGKNLQKQVSSIANKTSTSTASQTHISSNIASTRSSFEMTPLTLGSFIVGILLLVLLITSLATLLVSKITKRARRRANTTRCQQAIRQMEANQAASVDNPGFVGDSSSPGAPTQPLPQSTYSLLECPVCLELAWPPKRIYQCKEGHIICDTCKANPNLRNCPMCRIPLAANLTSRNRQLEALARTLKEEGQANGISGTLCSSPSAPAYTDITDQMEHPGSTVIVTEAFVPDISSAPEFPTTDSSHDPLSPLVVDLPPEID